MAAARAAYEEAIRKRYGKLAPAILKLYPGDNITDSMLTTLRDAIFGWAA